MSNVFGWWAGEPMNGQSHFWVVVLAMRCERSHTAKANNKFDEFLAKLSK
jgi:hypothetical protein